MIKDKIKGFQFWIYEEFNQLSEEFSHHLYQEVDKKVGTRGYATLALSGGSTPKQAYSMFADYDLQWKGIHLFQMDERWVPMDHDESNARLINETIVSKTNTNFHPVPRLVTPKESALSYNHKVKEVLMQLNASCIDIGVLGIGEDGHTASLFPGILSPEILESMGDKKVTHFYVPTLQTFRITMTPNFINSMERRYVLFIGKKKAKVFKDARDPFLTPFLLIEKNNTVFVTDKETYESIKQ